MTQARSTIVSIEESGVYHCVSRCVRRAYLCGRDSYTGCNYEHRRGWVRDRLKELSAIFGVEIFSYAVMSNHLHVVLQTRPDRVRMWHDEEVAKRWCRLFRGLKAKRAGKEFDEDKFEQIRKDRERIGICRRRLGDLSWFMRCLNESLARRANAEDECGGRFWEGRFHCQRLMDAGAILACMAYVDLNPVRAGMASGLEDSRFTSIYDRLVERRAKQRLSRLGKIDNPSRAQEREICREEIRQGQARWLLQFGAKDSPLSGVDDEYYTALVEWTGRTIRTDKRGYIPVKLKRVLDRFNLDSEEWAKNVESYGTLFYRLVGPAEDLMMFGKNRGQRWFRGRSSSEQLYKTEKKAA